MPAPTYKINVILENIHTTLEGITTANGYSVTVRLVTRKFFQYDQAPEYPCLLVIPEESRYNHLATTELYEGELRFSILGYIKKLGDVNQSWDVSTAVADLAADVMKALNADLRRGSLAYVDYTEITNTAPFYDWENNIGVLMLSGRVVYTFDKDEP